MKKTVAGLISVLGLTLSASLPNHAMAADDAVLIGVMNDQNGIYSEASGRGSVVAAKMAIEDLGGTILGKPVELLVANHQNKPDIGLAVAREWFDSKGVDAIFEVANSTIALGVQDLARNRRKIVIHSTSTSSDLTGKACSPYGLMWTADSWSNSGPLIQQLLKEGNTSYFFITADYAFGHSLESVASAAIKSGGGQVVGAVRVPLGTADYSSFLITAQSSKAQVIVLALAGSDLTNAIKQSGEFGITQKHKLATPTAYINDIHALGLNATHGLFFTQSWYWDQSDETRRWSQRFFDVMKRMPSDSHAGVYSSVTNYLKAVRKVGSKDPDAVLKAMRETPVSDIYTTNGHIREDGRVVYDRYLVRVKSAAESKKPWDYLELVAKIPAQNAFQSIKTGGCPLAQ